VYPGVYYKWRETDMGIGMAIFVVGILALMCLFPGFRVVALKLCVVLLVVGSVGLIVALAIMSYDGSKARQKQEEEKDRAVQLLQRYSTMKSFPVGVRKEKDSGSDGMVNHFTYGCLLPGGEFLEVTETWIYYRGGNGWAKKAAEIYCASPSGEAYRGERSPLHDPDSQEYNVTPVNLPPLTFPGCLVNGKYTSRPCPKPLPEKPFTTVNDPFYVSGNQLVCKSTHKILETVKAPDIGFEGWHSDYFHGNFPTRRDAIVAAVEDERHPTGSGCSRL
jgi:hypothetical protein